MLFIEKKKKLYSDKRTSLMQNQSLKLKAFTLYLWVHFLSDVKSITKVFTGEKKSF
jgi:hypothetical protein